MSNSLLSLSTKRLGAIACTLSLAAVALPAQKPKPARPTAAMPTPAVLTQRAKLEKIIHTKVLSNGLEVIVVENHGVPLAPAERDVRTGASRPTRAS